MGVGDGRGVGVKVGTKVAVAAGVKEGAGVGTGVKVETVGTGDRDSTPARSGNRSPDWQAVQTDRHRISSSPASARRPVRRHGVLGGAEDGAGTDMVQWPPVADGQRTATESGLYSVGTVRAMGTRRVHSRYAAGIDRVPDRVQTGDRSRLGDRIHTRAMLSGPQPGDPI